MAHGVITLGEMRAKGMTMLEVACRRCERRGRLSIERLIAKHASGMLDLRAVIAADCKGVQNSSTSIRECCGINCPNCLGSDSRA